MNRSRRNFIEASAAAGALLGSVCASVLNAEQIGRPSAMPTPRAKTLMSLFSLKYPIFEAPHGLATGSDLAIAVANAGAMGALALTMRSTDEARTLVSKVRGATKGIFFVNYILRRTLHRSRLRWTRGLRSCSSHGECRRRKCCQRFTPQEQKWGFRSPARKAHAPHSTWARIIWSARASRQAVMFRQIGGCTRPCPKSCGRLGTCP